MPRPTFEMTSKVNDVNIDLASKSSFDVANDSRWDKNSSQICRRK